MYLEKFLERKDLGAIDKKGHLIRIGLWEEWQEEVSRQNVNEGHLLSYKESWYNFIIGSFSFRKTKSGIDFWLYVARNGEKAIDERSMIMGSSKEFAEKNAGKYFLYSGWKVRVVGYNSVGTQIIITFPRGTKSIGWHRGVSDREDVLVIPTRASKFWYVDIEELK